MALPDWRLLAIGGVLLVGVVLIVLVLLMGSGPNPSVGTQHPDNGSAHVDPGTTCRSPQAPCGANPYSSTPGTSGPHWSSPGNWGVYSTPQSESQFVHNLEHGGIVIWYDPDAVGADALDELSRYVTTQTASGLSGRFKFILSPWSGADEMPAPIVATSWRWTLELEDVDTDAIDAFAQERYGIAPEPNGGPGPPA